jgi:acetyl-CoA acyltransferase
MSHPGRLAVNGRRVAIVAGLRTPFARAGTVLKPLSAIELGRLCVAELIQRTGIDGTDVDLLAFGTVVSSVQAPNIARCRRSRNARLRFSECAAR